MQIGNDDRKGNITIHKGKLEEITTFSYLDVIITEDGRDEKEINTRNKQARKHFL